MSLCTELSNSNCDNNEPPEFTIENNILKGKIMPINVCPEGLGYCILQHLESNSDSVGQINADTKEQYTFAKIRDLGVRCALWLIKHNVKPGDIISIFSYNHFDLFVPLLGSLFANAVFAPISYGINTKNAEYYLKLIEPKYIFVSEDSCDLIAEAIRNVNSQCKIIVFGSTQGCFHFDTIISNASTEDVANFKCQSISDINQTALILFSSGTTGLSKGVELSHKAVMRGLYRFEHWGSDFTRSLWYSSVSWISGVVMILNGIIKGTTRIFHANFDPNTFCQIVEKYKITYALISPTMMYQLHGADIINNYNLSHLKILCTTGAKIRKEVMDYFVSSLPNTCTQQCYGMTELGSLSAFPSKNKSKKDSIGTVTSNVEAKVVDVETEKTVGPNIVGELYFKTWYLMNGYYKNHEETTKIMDKKTGWIRSGDLGYYDEEGYIFIVDRLKEILKVKSHHVSPVEIEHVLMKHPGVEEAAVVGVPHVTDIDHPIAFVSKTPNSKVTEQELLNLAATLGDFHRLRAGVVFLDKLPQTASLKIDRKKIREMAKLYAKLN